MPRLPIERALEIPDPTQSHLIRAQCNVAACAFGDLSDMLGGIQQQLAKDNSTTVQTCEAYIFLQELETWLQSLPTELLLPTICESQRTGQELLENTINDASDARKVELVRIYLSTKLFDLSLTPVVASLFSVLRYCKLSYVPV